MAPTSARLRQASLTVVGETPRRRDSSRTVGSRVPTGSDPAVIIRPITLAMRRALRPSPSVDAAREISVAMSSINGL
jgi:hypothetical protein